MIYFLSSNIFATENSNSCIKVGVHQFPGIAVLKNGKEHLSGLDADIMREVGRETDKAICYQEYPILKDVFPALQKSEVDLMIGAFTITYDREKIIDFTLPYMISGSGILVAAKQVTGIGTIVKAIFTPVVGQAFLLFIAFLLVAGLFIWFAERGKGGGVPRSFPYGYIQACFCAFDIASTVGFGRVEPLKIIGRIVAIPVFVVGTMFIGTLIGSVSSALTLVEFEKTIITPEDLSGKLVATKSGSSSVDLLNELGAKVIAVETREQAVKTLIEGYAEAVVYDAPYLKFIAANNDELTVIDTFSPYYYGFAVPPESPLRDDVNHVLLKMQHSGQLDELTKQYFAK